MNEYSLRKAMLLEQLAAQEHAQLEAETAEARHMHLLATDEAAAAGMDLPTYLAVLQNHEQHQAATDEAAAAGMDLPTYLAVLQNHEQHQAATDEAAAAGMDLPTYLAALQNHEQHQAATDEAAAAGMDLPTYLDVLQTHEYHLTELARHQEQEQMAQLAQQHEQQQLAGLAQYQQQQYQALAEQEAAAAGMNLPTYAAALQEIELAMLEDAAYQEGAARHEAELAQQQWAAMPPEVLAYLQQLHTAQHQQAQALGLL
ncbi:hypothetical protein CR152_25445 [Massilia violaceinigra]|uniref:Uncharacterized protein n=1 Tax=Massilia violaceinigra TaxID=2045208 RepID=A0A2D2DRA3_9BURK|nr:hypothetical protein [Massilia violaceinigra]ATQ77473.1 hypothetical protein CR152_25445 [Massilia violaceinigra]